jgi:hypothetical protein
MLAIRKAVLDAMGSSRLRLRWADVIRAAAPRCSNLTDELYLSDLTPVHSTGSIPRWRARAKEKGKGRERRAVDLLPHGSTHVKVAM